MPDSTLHKDDALFRRIFYLAGLVVATSFFATLSAQLRFPAVAVENLPRLGYENNTSEILGAYFSQRSRIEQEASQMRAGDVTTIKRKAAKEALRRLTDALEPATIKFVNKFAEDVAAAEKRRFHLQLAMAAVTAVFVVLPLIRRGLKGAGITLLIPVICSVLAIVVSPESASRFALFGAITAGLGMIGQKVWRDQGAVRISRPSPKELLVAFLLGFIPVVLYVYFVGFVAGAWADSLIDIFIDHTEQVVVGGVSQTGGAVTEQAKALKAPWYDPREVFVYRPLRDVVKENAAPVTSAVTTSVQFFYTALRAVLQGTRLLSLLTIVWATLRFAVVIFGRAFVYAGGNVEFDLSPHK